MSGSRGLRRSEIERNRLRRENERLKEELEMARRRANRRRPRFRAGCRRSIPSGRAANRAGLRPEGASTAAAPRRRTYDAPLPRVSGLWRGVPPSRRVAVSGRLAGAAARRPRVSRGGRPVPAVSPPRPGPPTAADIRCARRGRRAARAAGGRARRNPQQTAAAILRQDRATPRAIGSGSPYRGGLVHAVHRAARQAQPTYDALARQVRGSPVVTPDETGWKVGGTTTGSGPLRRRTPRPTRSKTGAALRKRPGCSAPTTPACCSATAGRPIGNSSTPRTDLVAHLLPAVAR